MPGLKLYITRLLAKSGKSLVSPNPFMLYVSVCGSTMGKDNVISNEDTTPIAVIIPGLTSDSASVVSCRRLTTFTYLFSLKYYVCLVSDSHL